MKISIITLFPKLYESFLNTSIIQRAAENKLVEFNTICLFDMVQPKERVDEPTCGPGSGMILKPEVLEKAIEKCEQKNGKGLKIFFSPQGVTLNQKILKKLADKIINQEEIDTEFLLPPAYAKASSGKPANHIILVCSRYEGIDERVEQHYADGILSIGNYVLMGGDLPAQVFIEGFLRLIPEVVGKEESVEKESFSEHLLDFPQYGLPKEWKNLNIPEIVLSGDHAKIESWRKDQACKKTLLNNFEWLRKNIPNKEEAIFCKKHIPKHYVALMHSEIMLKDGRIGHSSVTSLDLHDIARSSTTYGVENFFMVSELKDQMSIIQNLLDFWGSQEGKEYNLSRHQAVSKVKPANTLDEVLKSIEETEGKKPAYAKATSDKPLIITTSAKQHGNVEKIDFFDQGKVWAQDRPVLIILGTGQGLSDRILELSDFLLVPVEGMTNYNHLSVRSAAAIILDRWLGLQPRISLNPQIIDEFDKK